MIKSGQLSLFIAITIWATIIGGILYSHIVYFPPYLSHLPESNNLITGDYGLHDGNFWMFVHPVAIVSTILALILNWNMNTRRKFILISVVIYALTIIATATYFLPTLMAFAASTNDTSITPSDLYHQGQTWQHLSWIRGSFMYTGFVMLLIAFTKGQ